VLAIAILRRLGMSRGGKLRAIVSAILRRLGMNRVRQTLVAAVAMCCLKIGRAQQKWVAFVASLTALSNSARARVKAVAAQFELEAQRNRQLRKIARAVKVGPLIIGRSSDLDALSKGLSVISAPQNGELRQEHSIVKCGPVAIMRARDIDSLIKPLYEFEAEVSRSRAAARSSDLAPGSRRDRRSVLFIHSCYYNFFYLAGALRKRGWDAVSASIEDPNGPNANFYHGEDVNLFDPEPGQFRRKLVDFFAEVESRFRMVHFHGVGCMSIFPDYFDAWHSYNGLPVDFLRLRQRSIKIGYTVSGCNDGAAQSSVVNWSGACNRCVWQDQPQVCSDGPSLAWGRKFHTMCDMVDTGGSPALDWKGKDDKVFRDALTMALDPQFWRPDLEIPEKYRLERSPGELIVYHAVGNYELRSRNGRNIKGTGAILAAIDRLKSEGFPVRLEFVTNVPSKDVRFIQVQADVMIDQLNYGRYGAQACEGMMLGRPVICYLKKDELPGISRVPFVEECPIVSATEQSIYDVLKDLLLDQNRRRELAKASRDFALKWHSADACAERFEQVYDRLMQGLRPAA
jgi:glycosyltransferase involved in cell wall biosynthesis